MKKFLALLLIIGVAFGGWYLVSPYLALMGLQEAVRDGDMAELEQRVDYPALRASAADQITQLARRRIDQGISLKDLRDLAGEVLRRSDDDAAQHRAARRRRLDSVFGDDLPELTSDESDEHHTGRSKDWYEAQRPPHHG